MSEPFWEHPTYRFMVKNWKLGVHLALHTRRFGVNNGWWSSFPSIIGRPFLRIILDIVTVRPVILNIKAAIIRAYACGFMAPEERIYMEPVVRFMMKFMKMPMMEMHLRLTREHAEDRFEEKS